MSLGEMREKTSSGVSGRDQNCGVSCRWQGRCLDPVDLRGRDVAFLKETKDTSSERESAKHTSTSTLKTSYFESAAPMVYPSGVR
jgi:hypothetical protein